MERHTNWSAHIAPIVSLSPSPIPFAISATLPASRPINSEPKSCVNINIEHNNLNFSEKRVFQYTNLLPKKLHDWRSSARPHDQKR